MKKLNSLSEETCAGLTATTKRRKLTERDHSIRTRLAKAKDLIILLISVFMDNFLKYDMAVKAFKGIRIAVGLLIVQAGINMTKKMMKKTPYKYISMGFVIVFFGVVMLLNIFQIHFSTMYLIVISGILGFCIYSMIGKRGAK